MSIMFRSVLRKNIKLEEDHQNIDSEDEEKG